MARISKIPADALMNQLKKADLLMSNDKEKTLAIVEAIHFLNPSLIREFLNNEFRLLSESWAQTSAFNRVQADYENRKPYTTRVMETRIAMAEKAGFSKDQLSTLLTPCFDSLFKEKIISVNSGAYDFVNRYVAATIVKYASLEWMVSHREAVQWYLRKYGTIDSRLDGAHRLNRECGNGMANLTL
jgi:hypothetical protein